MRGIAVVCVLESVRTSYHATLWTVFKYRLVCYNRRIHFNISACVHRARDPVPDLVLFACTLSIAGVFVPGLLRILPALVSLVFDIPAVGVLVPAVGVLVPGYFALFFICVSLTLNQKRYKFNHWPFISGFI